jgi:uncharacterized protein YdiU (UPF0061 family)
MMVQTANSEISLSRTMENIAWDNIYAQLPPVFYSRHKPEPLQNQSLIHFNNDVAEMIELDPAEGSRPDFTDQVIGVSDWRGTEPVAMCYAGHQFGQYVPRLGDGRAILLGQLIAGEGQRWDLQLKGSGLTMYSRQGDGKAVLRSSIREYICSAALAGLGIPTTHALALFGSDEEVYRETIETGAMILRVAPSHIRFGSFEYFFYRNRFEDLTTLGNFVLDNYFQHLRDGEEPFLALLGEVVDQTASLIAHWQAVGFCHGVMNSDNMSIHSITIDYGPYGFMDNYRAGHVCNHSDHWGRYAFDRQPEIGLFNLGCFAQAILPLLDDDPDAAVDKATVELNKYEHQFASAYLLHKRNKLGFETREDRDDELYDDLLALMEQHSLDFTNTFRGLSVPEPDSKPILGKNAGASEIGPWMARYRDRLANEGLDGNARSAKMKKVNPGYVLRNYMAENAIRAACDQQDYSEIDSLMALLKMPYDQQPGNDDYAQNSPEWAADLAVSCSS